MPHLALTEQPLPHLGSAFKAQPWVCALGAFHWPAWPLPLGCRGRRTHISPSDPHCVVLAGACELVSSAHREWKTPRAVLVAWAPVSSLGPWPRLADVASRLVVRCACLTVAELGKVNVKAISSYRTGRNLFILRMWKPRSRDLRHKGSSGDTPGTGNRCTRNCPWYGTQLLPALPSSCPKPQLPKLMVFMLETFF